jgi:hypothetical protein
VLIFISAARPRRVPNDNTGDQRPPQPIIGVAGLKRKAGPDAASAGHGCFWFARPAQLQPGLVLDAILAWSCRVLGDLRRLGDRRLQPDDPGLCPSRRYGRVYALHHAGGAARDRQPGDERSGRRAGRGARRCGWARAGVAALDRVVRAVRISGRLRTVIRAAVGLSHIAGSRVWRRVGGGRGARGGVRPGDAARASRRRRAERLGDRQCRRPDRQHPRLQPGSA